MIVKLQGKVIQKTIKSIYLATNGGIVFEVFVTTADLNKINLNSEIIVNTYLKVKDDGMELYGFLNEQEKEAFKILISISTVGPKTAISILNMYSYDRLLQIVEQEDIQSLTKVSGIGKKSASRIILELAGKLVTAKEATNIVPMNNNYEDAKEGLLGLGFDFEYLEKKLRELEKENPDMPVKEIIQKVLKDGRK